MNFDPASIAAMQQIATRGTPVVLEAAGRLAGLGQAEQNALLSGRVPFWLLLAAGVAAGWVLGVQAQKRGWVRGWLSTE